MTKGGPITAPRRAHTGERAHELVMSSSTRRRIPGLAILLALVATLLQPGVAAALPDEPGNLSPNGGSTGSNPQLTWDAVPGATTYRVQISANGSFSPLLVNEPTVN